MTFNRQDALLRAMSHSGAPVLRDAFVEGAEWGFREANRIATLSAASSSQGLTFRWVGNALWVGNFEFAYVKNAKKSKGVDINGYQWWGGCYRDSEKGFESKEGACGYCETEAKAFIAMLEGRE